MTTLAKWNPTPGLTTHAGEPIPPKMEFTVSPPSEIGEVITAYSSVGLKKQMTMPIRCLMSVGVVLLCGVMMLIIGMLAFKNSNEPLYMHFLMGCGFGLLAGIAAFFLVKNKYWTSYVGDHGAATYSFKNPEDPPFRQDVVVFADAAELKTKQTQNYQNHVYTGTNYEFTWKDQNGTDLMKLGGIYSGKDGPPKKLDDPFYSALVAESVYNDGILARVADEFETKGSVEFMLDHQRKVRVGEGFLEFDFYGDVDRLESDDIKKLSVNEGMFVIHSKDAKFFGSKGKFKFQYGEMGNAQIFLHALEQLAGFTLD